MIKKLLDKPFRLMSLIGIVYLIINIVLNLLVGFAFKDSFYPFASIVAYCVEGIVLVLFILTFILPNKHFIYYLGIEFLVFGNLYLGNIYTALFFSAILLVLLLTERKVISGKNIVVYSSIEVIKLLLVIPYGVTKFFYYIGLSLFVLCTIGCINLLFRHAYTKKDNSSFNLDDVKLTNRQKNCIKEIVLNNTTIKALAIDYNVSESAIKKDLATIYKVLGISGKADLKALFIDYKFDSFSKSEK